MSSSTRRRRLLRLSVSVVAAAGLLLLAAWLSLPLVPLPPTLMSGQIAEWDLLDRHEQPLRAVRLDNGPFRRQVTYAEIPQSLVQATLAAEDRRFWHHPGVDWRATLRAVGQFLLHGRVISGGSTITQQLIKIAQPRPRTLRAKFWQAVQALRLEQIWDKQHILCEYFNRLDYGNFNCGCASAAQLYFAKPLRDLSPAECALLAALPQAPSRLNPFLHPKRARTRQHWILGQMRRAGWLEEQTFQRALDEPLRLAPPRRVFEAPHFVDLVLASQLPSFNLQPSTLSGPSCLVTTLDLPLNRFAEETLRQHLARLQPQHVSNGALVVLDNRSGDVLALVGSENYFAPASGQVNGALARRSAGSTFKPFTYLLALERGSTPATVVADVPTEFATATGLFAPANYNRHCYGPMRYRLALANSLNIAAVKVLASIGGPEPLLQLMRECGLSTLEQPAEHYGLGLTIGTAEARLLELSNAYACLARLGAFKPWRLLLESPTPVANGNSPARRAGPLPHPMGEGFGVRVADPAAAFLIADILSDNAARSLAFGPESALRFDFPVACKTGTSSDFRDNWAFGYTPEFTVGVWVGNFDGSPMRQISGVTGAAPILHELFEQLHSQYGTTWYSAPSNIVECLIHPLTGKRLMQPTQDAVVEEFLDSNLPPWESLDDYATNEENPRAHSNAKALPTILPLPERDGRGEGERFLSFRKIRLGSEYRQWFATSDNWLTGRAVVDSSRESLRILFPLPGTTVYLDPDLPQQGSRLRLSATGPETVEWSSDSLQVVQQGNGSIVLLTEGRHRLTARDPATGEQAQSWLEVRAR